jgi:DNA-binding CsgD family transcriptional regulator
MPTRGGLAARVEEPTKRPPLRTVAAGSGAPDDRARSARLSGKERSVLRELARGYRTEQVAEALTVSPHTVRTHIKNSLRKLGARTRAHAVAIALHEGAIDFDPDE